MMDVVNNVTNVTRDERGNRNPTTLEYGPLSAFNPRNEKETALCVEIRVAGERSF